MISSQTTTIPLARAPAGALARARICWGKYHDDHVSPFHLYASKQLGINMVQNGTKSTMPRLRAYSEPRPQLKPRNLFSGLSPRWRRLPLVLRAEPKTVQSCQAPARPRILYVKSEIYQTPQQPAWIRSAALGVEACLTSTQPTSPTDLLPPTTAPSAAGPNDCTAFTIISHKQGGGQ